MAPEDRSALILYPDTSVLVAAFVTEPGSKRADAWLSESLASLGVSGWIEVEFTSALAAKARNGKIDTGQASAALSTYRTGIRVASKQLQVTQLAFGRAAEMVTVADGLRGGDALHLAIAEAHKATLVTFDRQQAALGAKLGVETLLL